MQDPAREWPQQVYHPIPLRPVIVLTGIAVGLGVLTGGVIYFARRHANR